MFKLPLMNTEIAKFHLEGIKGVQAEGPYYLCGASFGGMVAYEIAQQLHARGDRVALVAMFDTHSPNYRKRRPGMTRDKTVLRRRWRQAGKHLANLGGLDLPGQYQYLRLRVPSYISRLRLWFHNKYQELRYPLPEDLKKSGKQISGRLATNYSDRNLKAGWSYFERLTNLSG
jgi:pimeloyl-ACP methyl ester carboxylesterase